KHTIFNIGMTTFAHDPPAGSISVSRKHWVYQAVAVDFPSETWQEPIGTMERWGVSGEGPCTTRAAQVCTDRSPGVITLGANVNPPVGPFFGSLGSGSAFIYLDGTNTSNATKRIKLTPVTGKYGDAFTDGTFSTYTIA